MGIYYKGKKVASNRNVNHKDFVDCRDVEFTNPQEGDVPTWDSTAQKLVNKSAHGIFEVWANPNALVNTTFAGQTVEVASDVQYDGFFFIHGRSGELGSQQVQYLDSGQTASVGLWYGQIAMSNGTYPIAYHWNRNVAIAYNSSTHKYTFTFGDCTETKQTVNTTAIVEGTNNYQCAVERILGVIHND